MKFLFKKVQLYYSWALSVNHMIQKGGSCEKKQPQ